MYCRYCGIKLSDESKFCRQCGKPVKRIIVDESKKKAQEEASRKEPTAQKVAKALIHSLKANAAEQPGEFSYGTSAMDQKALNAAVKMLRGKK